jgi:hypothetical protein
MARFAWMAVTLSALFFSTHALAAQLTISPSSVNVAPLGTQMFTASGGAGSGYAFSLKTNASGGSITASGAYTAGSTTNVVDVVQVSDMVTADGGTTTLTATAMVTVGNGLMVMPSTASVAPGGMQTFSAAGGTPPYSWKLTTDGSGGASITTPAGVYTAGGNDGMDVVTATDSAGATATATITVTAQTTAIGSACTSSVTCTAGASCVDGVCCSSSCGGQCQACNTAGSMGTCVTISGPPVGTRSPCSQSDKSNVCTMKVCDGTSATSCTSFVGAATVCSMAACVDGIGTPQAVCQGDGTCQSVEAKSCGVFACVADQCATSCTDTAECSPGNYCDVTTGKCIQPAPIPDAGNDQAAASGRASPDVSTGGGCALGRAGSDGASWFFVAALLGLAGVTRRRA